LTNDNDRCSAAACVKQRVIIIIIIIFGYIVQGFLSLLESEIITTGTLEQSSAWQTTF